MGGDLGCFHVLATVNNASVNPGRRAGSCLFELAVWGDICPGVGLVCHMVVLSSVLGETSILFSQWLHLCTRLAALGARRGRRDSIPSLPPGPTPDMKAGTVSAFCAVLHSQGCFPVQQMFRKCLLSEGDGESWVGCEAYPRSVPLAATEAGLSHKTRPESGQGSQPGPQEQRSSQQSPGRTNTCPQFPPNSTSLGGKTFRMMLKCPKLCNVFGSNFEKLASQIY